MAESWRPQLLPPSAERTRGLLPAATVIGGGRSLRFAGRYITCLIRRQSARAVDVIDAVPRNDAPCRAPLTTRNLRTICSTPLIGGFRRTIVLDVLKFFLHTSLDITQRPRRHRLIASIRSRFLDVAPRLIASSVSSAVAASV